MGSKSSILRKKILSKIEGTRNHAHKRNRDYQAQNFDYTTYRRTESIDVEKLESIWDILFGKDATVEDAINTVVMKFSPKPFFYGDKIKNSRIRKLFYRIYGNSPKLKINWYVGKKNPFTEHHLIPRSRCPEFGIRDAKKHNTINIPKSVHQLWHSIFSNRTPEEVVIILLRYQQGFFSAKKKNRQKQPGKYYPLPI